jgi:branched-chain amino acid aminotransferase
LVTVQAKIDGYDGPIMLNEQGKVSEGPGSCLMIVRDGRVITPPITAGILESITRDTLIQLFEERLNIQVVERDIDKTELYIADEAFHCGSGHEIMAITSIDRYDLGDGSIGPVTRQIRDLYFDIVRGRVPEYAYWLTTVY